MHELADAQNFLLRTPASRIDSERRVSRGGGGVRCMCASDERPAYRYIRQGRTRTKKPQFAAPNRRRRHRF